MSRRVDPVELRGPQPRAIDYAWAVPYLVFVCIPLSLLAEIADRIWGPPR